MRFLVYLFTLLLFSTAVAQNPVILQGSYVTNVFGPSNFIKNPNAQNNTSDVFTSGGVITRSLTTPLVATTEFNVTTNTSTNNIYWTTRTFDAGTKNQNCEARFTYRGFTTGTTTAQITNNNTTVIAELVLVPSASDPRTVSINFPCGDPSTSKELRLQQSVATLTGVNEIGGIYMGLATNMANVAQAEFVGQSGYGYSGDLSFETVSNTYADLISNQTLGAGVVENQGNASSSAPTAGVTPLQTTIANPKPGNYYVTFSGVLRHDNTGVAGNCAFRIAPVVNGVMDAGGPDQAVIYTNNTGQTELSIGGNASLAYQLTSTPATLSFKLMGKLTTGGGACRARIENSGSGTGATRMKFTVHRFPLASELVVTPERQSWYIDGYHGGTSDTNLGVANVSAFTEITNSVLSFVPATGSQPVATLCASGNNPPALSTSTTTCSAGSESVGITFNIPSVGTYEVCTQLSSYSDTSTATLNKSFVLDETSTTSSTRLTTNKSIAHNQFATAATTQPVRLCQFFNFTSLGQKAVRLFYQQAVGGSPANSLIITDNFQDRAIKWTVRPVTNQSNSALYVQGPVKAAETGAAIPAGYVGQVIEDSFSMSTTCSSSFPRTLSTPIPPGVWLVQFTQDATSGTAGDFGIWSMSWTSATAVTNGTPEIWATQGALRTQWSSDIGVIRITSSLTSYSASCRNTTGNAIDTKATFIRLN